MTTVEVPLGAKVSVSAGIGHVRWTGINPKFSSGKWVGVELLEGTGKNDGSVNGDSYFICLPNHGVFVRPSQVKILEVPRPAPRPPVSRPPSTPSVSRLSATPSTNSRAVSPQKAPARTPPRTASRTTSLSTATPVATPKRPSISATPSRASQANIFQRPASVAEITPRAASASSSSHLEDPHKRVISPTSVANRAISPLPPGIPEEEAVPPSFTTALSPPIAIETSPKSSSRHGPSRSPSPDKDASVFAHKRELEELRIKIRILENRKVEDAEKIKTLEAKVGEADILRAARVKLQAKFQELQSSLVAAQRLSRDLQSENAHLETKAAEAVDQLEMATLDREVAEEKAEASDLELESLKEQIAELELEVAVLKEENEEYDKPPTSGVEGERSSLAFVQLEKHNERLKEALIRLRDVSSEAEREHKAKLGELQKDLNSQEDLSSQLGRAEGKLLNAEAHIEDLKLQLDDALGAEDMLEQLTERNLQMSERIEEMRISIEDLEALKDLNDELEENHVEAEKQLQDEIDTLTIQLRDERIRSGELDSLILDMESTIGQFRELVASLQSEIDSLRVQQASQEFESATFSKESQAVMNLNLKLQSTAVKAQSKTVDLELRKLEAAQLAEHMRIVQAYLPDPYYETEADSTALYLFFHRLSSKLDMLVAVISQVHGLPAALHTASSEILVGVCELRGKLRHFSTLNKRFAAVVSRSSPEDWVAFGKVLPELAGVENKVDGWISLIRTDEFREGDCARDLASLIAQFDHLAEISFNKSGLDVGEQQLGLAYSFDYDLDNFAAAVGFARQAIVSLTSDEDIEIDVGESSLDEGVYEPVQRILDQVRSVKVPSGKLVAQLEDMVLASAALLPDLTLALNDLAVSVSNAVDLAVQLAQRIGVHVASIRSTKSPLRLTDIEGFLQEITAESSALSDAPPWELIGMFVSRLGSELGAALPKVKTAVKSGSLVSMNMQSPWLARVGLIKEAATYNADTERKVVRLSEELKDMLREVKVRDQTLQESGVKVETLERRLEATRKQADAIIELENDVAKAKKQEKVYEDAIEQLQAEQDALEAENARLRKGQGTGPSLGERSSNLQSGNETVVLGAGGIEAAQLIEQVENLKSAIRYLRSENALLKSKNLYNDLHLLPALSVPVSETPVPELDPSSPASPASSSSSADDAYLPITPTRQSLDTESKLLYREITRFQASPRIVDISQLGGGNEGQRWRSKKSSPENQMWAWKREEKKLEKRVESLNDRVRSLGVGLRRS
ncbi:dynactin 1, partial [Tremellales sp. Uapishka_1]